jgi:hypothetical protein
LAHSYQKKGEKSSKTEKAETKLYNIPAKEKISHVTQIKYKKSHYVFFQKSHDDQLAGKKFSLILNAQ